MVETGFGPIAILSEPVVAPAGGHPRPQTWSEGGKDNRISEITPNRTCGRNVKIDANDRKATTVLHSSRSL